MHAGCAQKNVKGMQMHIVYYALKHAGSVKMSATIC